MIRAARDLARRHRQTNWALVDQALVSGANFATMILLARVLGLDAFGRFALAWMAVQFVAAIHFALASAPMMSIGPKQPAAERPGYFAVALAQQALAALALSLALGLAAGLGDRLFPAWDAAALAAPLAGAALALLVQDYLRRHLFTRGHGRAALANDAIRCVGQLAVLGGLTLIDRLDEWAALWAIAAVAAIAAVMGLGVAGPLAWSGARFADVARRHWRFARWLVASAAMQWLSGNLFFVAAGALLGPVAVGALKASQNLLGVTHILFQGLENVVPARAARVLAEAGAPALVALLRRVAWGVGAATALVALVAAAAPALWLGLLFGDAYAAYGAVLRWFALVYVAMALGFPLRAGLRALESTRAIFFTYAWALAFSLVAAYPLVEVGGALGAVLGLLIVNLGSQIILWLALRRALSALGGVAPA